MAWALNVINDANAAQAKEKQEVLNIGCLLQIARRTTIVDTGFVLKGSPQ